MLDLKIRNGRLLDGTGSAALAGDLGIRDGRIVAIGRVDEAARETFDAQDQVVCPGFIDTHTHYDAQVFWDPLLTPSCLHGVTTVLAGNCGFSIAPLTRASAEYLAPMLARVEGMPLETLRAGVPWDWTSFGSYLDRIEGTLGLNAGFFVGHSAIRRAVMAERAVGHVATAVEIEAMETLLDESLRAGALGLSTTISRTHNDGDGNPVPSRHAAREEFLALAAVCARHEGTGLELLPNLEFDQATIDLMVDFSLAGQRPVNWNVLAVASGSESEAREAERKLAISDFARSKGAEIIALAFVSPPTVRVNFRSGMVLDALPGWAPLFRLALPERIEKLRDPQYRRHLEAEASKEKGIFRGMVRWQDYLLSEVHSSSYRQFQGRVVGDVARELGRTPFDTLIDIALADDLETLLVPPGGEEDRASYELRARVWTDDRVVVGASDAGAHMDMIDTFAFSTALLEKGVRKHQVITLEEAVHRLTQVPARMMGLRERGLLRAGWHADVVVFDPSSVGQGPVHMRQDLPGGQGRLFAEANGISRVIVNGTTIVRDGQHTGARPGTLLRSGRDTRTNAIPANAGGRTHSR